MFVAQFSDVSNDFSTIAATEALPAFGVLLIVVAIASWFLARRDEPDHNVVEWFVGLATLALIVAVTTLRGEIQLGFRPAGLLGWVADFNTLSRDPLSSSQFMLNVALFVPAGVVWAWLTRRPLRALGGLFAFSFAVECIQGVTGAGANDIVDLISNTAGAAIGVGLSAVLLQLLSRRIATPMTKQARTIVIASIAVVLTLVAIGWFVGASARQQHVEDVLRREFAGTNAQEFERRMSRDSMDVFLVDGIFSDGAVSDDDSISLRYPATFFSLHRCVYVTWTADAVDFRRASGSECSDFLG